MSAATTRHTSDPGTATAGAARPASAGNISPPHDIVMELTTLLPDLAVTLCEAAPHGCRGFATADSLTSRQMRAVIYLAHRPGTTMGELADGLGIGRAAATELVARLEEKDILRRRHSDNDRRLVLVSLSGRAEGYADAVLVAWRDRLAAVLAQFPDLHPELLAAFLRAFMQQWKRPT